MLSWVCPLPLTLKDTQNTWSQNENFLADDQIHFYWKPQTFQEKSPKNTNTEIIHPTSTHAK